MKKRSSKTLQNAIKRAKASYGKTEFRMLLASKIEDAIAFKYGTKINYAAVIDQEPSVISKWVSGAHNFTTDTLLDIQRTLDIKVFHDSINYELSDFKEPKFNYGLISELNKFLAKNIIEEPSSTFDIAAYDNVIPLYDDIDKLFASNEKYAI